jgi:hypothetical protein
MKAKAIPVAVPEIARAPALSLIGHVPGLSIESLANGIGLSHAGTVRLVDRERPSTRSLARLSRLRPRVLSSDRNGGLF